MDTIGLVPGGVTAAAPTQPQPAQQQQRQRAKPSAPPIGSIPAVNSALAGIQVHFVVTTSLPEYHTSLSRHNVATGEGSGIDMQNLEVLGNQHMWWGTGEGLCRKETRPSGRS